MPGEALRANRERLAMRRGIFGKKSTTTNEYGRAQKPLADQS
jgi:hypothetical protein